MQWCEHWKVVEQPLACLSRWYLLLFDMASCDLFQVFYCQFPGPGASKGSGSTLARLCWWGNFHTKSQRPAPRGNSLGHHETYKLFRKWKINVCGQVCSGQHVYIWHIVSMIIYCILIERLFEHVLLMRFFLIMVPCLTTRINLSPEDSTS